MTQALINSLNIITEKKANLTDKMSKNTGMDFGKIFETKTNKLEKKTNNYRADSDNIKKNDPDFCNQVSENTKQTVNETKNISNDKLPKTTNKQENINNDENKNTTNQLHGIVQKSDKSNSDNLPETSENITSDEANTIIIIENDVCSNLIIADDESYNANEITITDKEADNLDTADITDEESDNTDTTAITEEEPTMYNELITLEDPTTALLMFQSQIQKVLTTTAQDEQTEITNETNTNTGSQSLNNTDTGSKNNTSVFKQLDAQFVKNTQAEITRPKTETHKSSNVLNENIVKELNVEVINSQSAEAESSMEDFMQNQSPQEQTARIMIQGDIKYEAVASETEKNITQTKTSTNITPGRIIEQISKQLEGMFNNSKLNMVLNPGTLGKLNLQLVNSKEGIIAQFTVTTQEAKDILLKGLNGLKETLIANGVNVDNVSVKLENTESEQESDYTEQEGSRGGNKHQGAKKQKNEEKDFEEMMFNLENEGNV